MQKQLLVKVNKVVIIVLFLLYNIGLLSIIYYRAVINRVPGLTATKMAVERRVNTVEIAIHKLLASRYEFYYSNVWIFKFVYSVIILS